MFKKTAYKIVKSGTPEQLRAFLKKYPDKVDERTKEGTTALIHAAYRGRADMIKVLLEFDAALDCMNKHNYNALILASHYGHHDCVKLLLDAGADTTLVGEDGQTAEQSASITTIKNLFTKHREAQRTAATKQAPTLPAPSAQQFKTAEFCKDGDYLVSITEHTEVTKLSLTTVYNFRARTVTYLQGTKEAAPNVVPFNKAASTKELQAAAAFLESEQGNTHGFKPKLIQ